MAQTVKITPASGLLEFIGNTTSNKPYLQHDDNGNLTLTLQATKKFTVAGNLKVNGKVTMAQQTLTDGAAITWDFNSGANAKVTLAGARTLVISNMEAGDTGLILVKQDAAGSRTLILPGSSSIVGGGSYTASPAANATDVLGVYFDGTTYWWTIGYNTVTPPLTSVGITGGDFVIANSPLTANGNIGLALATVNSTVGTFGSATAVPVITVNAKGLVTAVSTTNISIPTNLDSLTDVTITSAATNQLLQFNGSQWVNWSPNYLTGITSGQVTTALGYTPVPPTRTLSINGTAYDLSADRSWTITTPYVSKLQHAVKAGVAINKGQAVYVTSADGTNMIVGLASNATESTSSKTMGLLDDTVSTNGFANVVTEGLLAGLNTIGAAVGDPVWLGTSGNLIYGLVNKPYAPNHLVFIGIVTRVNANNGEIFVKVQNGFELDELHDVDLKTNLPTAGQLLRYNSDGLWKNWSPNYLTSYTETDTLASVTGRGATTNTASVFGGGLYARGSQHDGDYSSAALWTESYNNTTTGIAFHISGIVGKFLEMRTDQALYWDNEQVWHTGNLTNLNQLTNGPGYITGYTETNTFLGDGGSANTHPGTDRIIFTGQLSLGAAVLGMPSTDNSNAILNINRHPGEYNSQLGFSSNGSMYYRSFSATAINNTQAWRQVWDSDNLTNLNQLTNGPAYITTAALSGYATQTYVNTAISNLIDAAPSTLDTLNELAAALGDDPNFATSFTTLIGNKVSKSGDTMTGVLTINTNVAGLILNRDAVSNYNGIYYSTANVPKWFIGMRENLGSNNHIHYSEELTRDILTLNVTNGNATVFGTITASNFSGSSSGTNTGDQTNISGNAATATNIAWTGVTGRPTALSQFSNDLGNYGGWLTQAAADPLYVNVTGDSMTGPLVITGTTSGQELFAVNGVNGRLFTVSDDLSNSLFSVNTVAGLPVIEAFANNTVNIGPFSAPIVINASGISTPSHGTSANWNSAYNDTITSAAVSGTTSKTLTLTQRDGGTVTATWTDIDTDTNTDQQTLSVNGSTLSISGGNSITLPTSGISQATADGLYAAISHSHTFASLTSKPTTISGYGITDAITTGNIGSQSVNYATYAAYVENDSYYMRFHWSGQDGQPTWLWGGDEGENMYVYDPSNFSVNYANSAGALSSMNISQFTNNSGYLTAESDTLATVTGRGATTTTPIIVTASEGREVAVYIPSSYTTDDLVSGHEYGWYSDHWRLGMTRSGGAQGADFVVQWNAARRLSLTNGGNLTVTGTISSTNFSGTHSGSSSGTNTGDQTNISGNAATATALTSMNISQFTNNSGYITSYSETDTLYSVTNRGNTTIQDIEFTNGRKGLVGRYDATQTQAIFAMGAQYVLQDGAASGQIGNLYGLAWSYNPDYGGAGNNPQSIAGLNHQLLLMQNGITTAAMGSGIWTSGNITAANFSGSSSGTNTGDQTNISGNAATATYATSAGNADTVDSLHASDLVRAYSTSAGNIDSDWGQSFKTFDPIPSGTPPLASPNIRTVNIGDSFSRRTQLAFDYSSDTAYFRRRTEAGWFVWREFIHSGNISTQTVATAGALSSMNISQFTNNSGYLTSITSGNVTTALGYTPWHAGNDGAGSGLDADLLDGYNADTAANVNTIVRRDSSGNIYSNYVLGSYFNASAGNSANPTIGQIWTQDTSDNYLRKSTPSHFRSQVTDGYYLPLTGGTITGTVNFSNNTLEGVGHIIMADSGFGEGIQWEHWFICDSPDDNSNTAGNLQFVYVPDNSVRMTFDTGGTLTLSNRLVELSSIRYKTNVESLTPALDKVLQLRPVYYTKIGGTGSTEIGLIAEEVAEIYPELIKYNDAGQVDGINYTRIAPILIKTIQEQQELIKKLTERIENLENR